MSLLLATLITGLVLMLVGLPLVMNVPAWNAVIKAFPRSRRAAYVLFTLGAAWFLYAIWNLSAADFGEFRVYLFIAFAAIAGLSFKCVPDFLAVRGLCTVILMGAMPLLTAAYMEYDKPQRLLMVSIVYLAIGFAIWLGAQPWRMRDFLAWLFARPQRTQIFGGFLAGYGLLLAILAFTY